MTDEVEAIGQMATAGLAATALGGRPRRAGPRVRGAAHLPAAEPRHAGDLAHGACANCGTVLTGAFCASCGQSAHVHRSVGHIFEEFLHGIWHFDSKAWRTVPRLAFAPGRLTRDYVYGKRAGYIAPLALFLFSIFLMFFVFGLVGGPDIDRALDKANASQTPVMVARTVVADAKSEVADARTELADADADTRPEDRKELAARLATNEASLTKAEAALATVLAHPPTVTAGAPAKGWKTRLAEAARSGELKVDTGLPRAMNDRVREALQNPDFALYRIEQKAYKLSFLLIPLSLPVLWLLFAFRRDVHTYDHVVFALYSLSFMSLLFVVMALLSKMHAPVGMASVGAAPTLVLTKVGAVLIFAAPIHMFAQLKGAYRLGWFGALWRTLVLGTASLVILGLFAALIVVVGLAD